MASSGEIGNFLSPLLKHHTSWSVFICWNYRNDFDVKYIRRKRRNISSQLHTAILQILCYQTYEETCVILRHTVYELGPINVLKASQYHIGHLKWKHPLVISSLFLACGYNKEENCFCVIFYILSYLLFHFFYGPTCYLPFRFYSTRLLSTSLLK